MAKEIIVGNWKMYKTGAEAKKFIRELIPLVAKSKSRIGLAVPFTALSSAADEAEGSNILIGAQNMSDAREGAFTGEIAASMLKDAGASFVLVGHSERRLLFHETDEMIRAKLMRALEEGITPILCIGETKEERESGHKTVIERQLHSALEELDPKDLSKIIIAYEPVWAIGTGQTATAKVAQETHAYIRSLLVESYGVRAGKVAILYGGSVKPENAKTLLQQKDINGALVGGASLDVENFAKIATMPTRG